MKAPSTAAKFYAFFAQSIRETDAEARGWEKTPLTSREQAFAALEMSWRRMREDERNAFELDKRSPETFKRPLKRA